MTEKLLQEAVIECARMLGWRVYHTHDSRRSQRGFPDLVLVRDRVLFVELKTEKGRMGGDQFAWGSDLMAAGAEWHVWRPADWASGLVEEHLRSRWKVSVAA